MWDFDDPVAKDMCEKHQGAMNAIWFWSGLVFWFDFCTCLMLAIGQHELALQGRGNAYEHIGGSAPPSAVHQQSSTFAGDYSNIPDIQNNIPQSGMSQPSSFQASVQSV